MSALQRPLGFEIAFTDSATTFRKCDVADVPELVGQLSVRQRMALALRHGAKTADSIADEIDAKKATVQREARRHRKQFIALPGGQFGLVGHGS